MFRNPPRSSQYACWPREIKACKNHSKDSRPNTILHKVGGEQGSRPSSVEGHWPRPYFVLVKPMKADVAGRGWQLKFILRFFVLI